MKNVFALFCLVGMTCTAFATFDKDQVFCDDDGTEFKFFTKRVTHRNASKVCQRFGGHLASLDSAQKIQFIQEMIQDFGLNQAVVGVRQNPRWGYMEHMNGTALSVDLRKLMEPYHVIFDRHGLSIALKNPTDGGRDRGFLCQRNPAKPSTCRNKAGKSSPKSALKIQQSAATIPPKNGANHEITDGTNATKPAKILDIFTEKQLETQKQVVVGSFEKHFSTVLPRFKASGRRERAQTPNTSNFSEIAIEDRQGVSESNYTAAETATFKPPFAAFAEVDFDGGGQYSDLETGANDRFATGAAADRDDYDTDVTRIVQRAADPYEPDAPPDEVPNHTSTPVQSDIKALVETVALHQSLSGASELLDNVSLVLEAPEESGESPNARPISPTDLLEIAESLLPVLAPANVSNRPPDFSIAPDSSQQDSPSRDEQIAQYAISFMRVTSNLLNPVNAESWQKAVSSQNSSRKATLTPSSLMEQMDAVLEYSAASFVGTTQDKTIFVSEELDVQVEFVEEKDLVDLEVQADGKVALKGGGARKRRSSGRDSTLNSTLTVVTANYKSAAQILEACVNVSSISLGQTPAGALGAKKGPGNACARSGIMVTDSLCDHMFQNATAPATAVWTFPSSSNLLSISAFERKKKRSIPVRFHIRDTGGRSSAKGDGNHAAKCVYYDARELLWSDFGCRLVAAEDGENYSCRCNHTTNFAILLLVPLSKEKLTSVDVYEYSPSNELCGTTLQMVSYIVGGLSIAFLAVSVAFFAYARQRSERTVERNTVHMCLAVSMLCLHAVLLADRSKLVTQPRGGASEPDWICYVVTALTHFFLLCNFAWMSVEGVLLYVLVVVGNKRLGAWKHVIGWGVPMATTGATFAVAWATQVPYVRQIPMTGAENVTSTPLPGDKIRYVCYLSGDLIWASIGPVVLSILVNFAIAARLIAVIGRLTKESRMYRPSGQRGTPAQINVKAFRKSFAAFLKLNPLLGFPWIVGFVASFVPQQYQCYVIFAHTCINGTQGAFFFFVTVVENEESRSLIRLTWRKLRHNTNSFMSSLKPRRSSSYPLGTPNHKPNTSLTPPSGRHRIVTSPHDGDQLQANNVLNCESMAVGDSKSS